MANQVAAQLNSIAKASGDADVFVCVGTPAEGGATEKRVRAELMKSFGKTMPGLRTVYVQSRDELAKVSLPKGHATDVLVALDDNPYLKGKSEEQPLRWMRQFELLKRCELSKEEYALKAYGDRQGYDATLRTRLDLLYRPEALQTDIRTLLPLASDPAAAAMTLRAHVTRDAPDGNAACVAMMSKAKNASSTPSPSATSTARPRGRPKRSMHAPAPPPAYSLTTPYMAYMMWVHGKGVGTALTSFPAAYATQPAAGMRGAGLFPEESLLTHLRRSGVVVVSMPKDALHFSSLSVGSGPRNEYVFRQEACEWSSSTVPCDCHGQGLGAAWLAHGERARKRAIQLLGLADPYA